MGDLTMGEHKQNAELVKKNPNGLVPFIDDGGFTLSESCAILKYIACSRKVADHWCPKDPKQQARLDEYLFWQPNGIRKPCVQVFLGLLRGRMSLGGISKIPLDEAALKEGREAIKKSVAHLANYFLQNRQFILGDEISIADIIAVCELIQIEGVGEEALYTDNKIVRAWFERVKTRLQPHFDVAMERNAGIKKMYIEEGKK